VVSAPLCQEGGFEVGSLGRFGLVGRVRARLNSGLGFSVEKDASATAFSEHRSLPLRTTFTCTADPSSVAWNVTPSTSPRGRQLAAKKIRAHMVTVDIGQGDVALGNLSVPCRRQDPKNLLPRLRRGSGSSKRSDRTSNSRSPHEELQH
jgi:hypothetical protein